MNRMRRIGRLLEFRRNFRKRRQGLLGKRERRNFQRLDDSGEKRLKNWYRAGFHIEFRNDVRKRRVRGFRLAQEPGFHPSGYAAFDFQLDQGIPPALHGYERLPTMGRASRFSGNRFPSLARGVIARSDAVLSMVRTSDKRLFLRSGDVDVRHDDVRWDKSHRIPEWRAHPLGIHQYFVHQFQSPRFPFRGRRRGNGIPVRWKTRRTSRIFARADGRRSQNPVRHFQIIWFCLLVVSGYHPALFAKFRRRTDPSTTRKDRS